MCSQLGAKLIMSTAHHHETAGQAERMNRVLEETLRHFVVDKMDNWDEMLPAAKFAVNNSFNRSIMTTTFHLNYGYHQLLPLGVGVSPNPDVSHFLAHRQQLIQSAGTCHASAQQRPHADAITALVARSTESCTLPETGSSSMLTSIAHTWSSTQVTRSCSKQAGLVSMA